MLEFNKLAIRRGPRVLFEDASFTIHRGYSVGVTGSNGCGKSSLFALILKQIHSDAGDFSLPPDTVIAHVAQETPAVERSAIDYVLDGDADLRKTQARLASAELEDILSLPIFMLASILARGIRFFIIAALLWRYGNKMRSFIEKRLGLLFSIAVALVVIGFLGVKWL